MSEFPQGGRDWRRSPVGPHRIPPVCRLGALSLWIPIVLLALLATACDDEPVETATPLLIDDNDLVCPPGTFEQFGACLEERVDTPGTILCGNGIVEEGETCDDGDRSSCTGDCNGNCTGPATTEHTCGNGILECFETCDEGDEDPCGVCNADCTGPGLGTGVCGNGVVECVEVCDDGDQSDCGTCNAVCNAVGIGGGICGNGNVECSETCDDGDQLDCGPCAADCRGPGIGFGTCGNGVLECGETCDEGETDPCSGECNETCTGPANTCGDGIARCGEVCDDGNRNNFDSCNNRCLDPSQPQPGERAWAKWLRAQPAGSPALDGMGRIYIATKLTWLQAYESGSGDIVWEYQEGALKGHAASIAISDRDLLFVGALDSRLHAYTRDGERLYSRLTAAPVRSTPSFAFTETVLVLSSDQLLYAFLGSAGLRWKYPLTTSAPASPVVLPDNRIVIAAGSALLALDGDGALAWSLPIGATLVGEPAVDGEGNLWVTDVNGGLSRVSRDGAMMQHLDTGKPASTGAAIDAAGRLYFGTTDGELVAVRPDGTIDWAFAADGAIASVPAIGDDGTVYCGTVNGAFHALNGSDGSSAWMYQTPKRVPIEGSPTIEDGKVFFASQDQYLYAYHCSSNDLNDGPWPKYRGDRRNSGRFR